PLLIGKASPRSTIGSLALAAPVLRGFCPGDTMPERISVPNPEELAQRLGTLTTREIEVLTLIGEGLTYAEIAQRMKRSRKTIETHRLFIGRKLGVSKQVVLARIAIQAGFVSVPGARITAPAAPADLRAELARRKKSQEALRRIDIATTS